MKITVHEASQKTFGIGLWDNRTVSKSVCHFSKVFNEPPVVVCQAQKLLHFSYIPRSRPGLHLAEFVMVGFDPILRYDVA